VALVRRVQKDVSEEWEERKSVWPVWILIILLVQQDLPEKHKVKKTPLAESQATTTLHHKIYAPLQQLPLQKLHTAPCDSTPCLAGPQMHLPLNQSTPLFQHTFAAAALLKIQTRLLSHPAAVARGARAVRGWDLIRSKAAAVASPFTSSSSSCYPVICSFSARAHSSAAHASAVSTEATSLEKRTVPKERAASKGRAV